MPDSARFALHRPELLASLILGEQKIAALMQGNEIRLPAEATLVQAGRDHHFVYRLQEGWAGRSRLLPDGRSQFILVFLPGDLFAVKSMFMNQHPDSIVALSAMVAQRIHYRDLHDAYTHDSDVANRCIWQVMEEERRLHSWVTSLGQGSAEERLARLLVDFRGRLIAAEAIAGDSMAYQMPLTQGQLAEHLGITAVHVNRVLKGFREAGIVTVREGLVAIGDLKQLARHASALLDTHERATPAYTGAHNKEPHE